MKLYDKRTLIGTCYLVVIGCLYGFIAAGEPGGNNAAFRVGYAVVGFTCFILAFIFGRFLSDKP